jgi:peptide deformylase
MAIRKIREIGDSVLNKPCKEVTEMTPRIKTLIQDMLDTMYDAYGVGLAAPQVGILKRIVVIDTTGEDPMVLINPTNHRNERRTNRIRGMLKRSREKVEL